MSKKTKKKARRGRPPKKASERRHVALSIRFTRAEHRELRARAMAKGVTLGEYVRRYLFEKESK